MAESTRVSDKEIERRESYIRANYLTRNLADPFSWSYEWKAAGTMFGLSVVSAFMHNRWNKKPYYYAIIPRTVLIAAITALGYGAGALRVRHYQTRDAVIEHYMKMHPEDFNHFNDRNGRPFSQVLLPWYPRRAQYTKFE